MILRTSCVEMSAKRCTLYDMARDSTYALLETLTVSVHRAPSERLVIAALCVALGTSLEGRVGRTLGYPENAPNVIGGLCAIVTGQALYNIGIFSRLDTFYFFPASLADDLQNIPHKSLTFFELWPPWPMSP